MSLRSIKRRLFARWYDRAMARYESLLRERKRALFTNLSGTVVELGPGTGVNLELLPTGISWIGIEPNEHMHPLLRTKAAGVNLEVDLRKGTAGNLPLDDQSVDSVLSTLVLCSVDDVAAVLAEIRRVLKPGGQFVFWEHVIDPHSAPLRAFQRAFNPLQRFIGDGCCCNRDFASSVRAAGFSELELEEFSVPSEAAPAWVRPHVCGVATR